MSTRIFQDNFQNYTKKKNSFKNNPFSIIIKYILYLTLDEITFMFDILNQLFFKFHILLLLKDTQL